MFSVSGLDKQRVGFMHITEHIFFSLELIWQHLKIIVSVLLCPNFISLFQQHYNSVGGPLNMQTSVN